MSRKVLILVNHEITILNFRTELVEKLVNEGYEVIISSPIGKKVRSLSEIGCIVEDIKINRHGMNVFEDLNILKEYRRLIKKYSPDVIVSYTIKPNIYGGIIGKTYNIPQIMTITGLGNALQNGGVTFAATKFLYNISVSKKSHIVFQNIFNKDFFFENIKKMKNTYLVNGSGVNLEKFKFNEAKQKTSIKILYFGRVKKDKGIDELLSAAAQFKDHKNITFKIVGLCEENYLEIMNIYSSKGIISYREFSNNIINEIYKSDVVVLPSYHEGMSNSLLESAACGRPLLASNIPGCQEIIDDGVNGFLFEPKNVQSLVNSIIKFSTLSFEERKTMGVNSRAKVENEFDRNIVVRNYIDIIKKITGEKNEKFKN